MRMLLIAALIALLPLTGFAQTDAPAAPAVSVVAEARDPMNLVVALGAVLVVANWWTGGLAAMPLLGRAAPGRRAGLVLRLRRSLPYKAACPASGLLNRYGTSNCLILVWLSV